jgi:osmotically-inducible protein OsmY
MLNRLAKSVFIGFIAVATVAAVGCTPTRTRETAGETVDDSVITAKVKTALVDDPTTKARQISVETYRGVVQLSGFVDSSVEKSRASEVAKKVAGVKDVRNSLEVKQSAS